MAHAIRYEIETCGRCGGCGRYSYNQIDGDRCYGCGGTGKRLSDRGRRAKAAVAKWIADHCAMTAGEVQVGDRVTDPGTTVGWFTVTAIETENQGGVVRPDGSIEPFLCLRTGARVGRCYVARHKLARFPRGAEWEALVAYLRRFKGATVVEQEAA